MRSVKYAPVSFVPVDVENEAHAHAHAHDGAPRAHLHGAPPLPRVTTNARRPSGKFGSGGKPSVAHAAAGVGNAPSCEQPKTLATTG